MFFQKKPLLFNQETIGYQLRLAREQKNLKIEAIAKKLIIKPEYLKALEDDKIDLLPKGVYAKNFLREYAGFLGLNYKELLKQFSNEIKIKNKTKENLFERQVVAKKYLIAIPNLIRNLLIILVAVICLVYIIVLLNKIFSPPRLVVMEPITDIQTTIKQLKISGQTEPESSVKINEQVIKVDNNGKFEQIIYLESGLNTVIIKSKKKHSQEAEVIRRILFEDKNPSS